MKKGYVILCMCFASVLACQAQTADTNKPSYVRPLNEQAKAHSNTLVGVGFGFGGYYPYSGPMYTESANLITTFDRTIIKHVGPGNISLGGIFSYKEIASYYTDARNIYNYTQHWNYYTIGARIEYHWQPAFRNFDSYAGAMAGYYITRFGFSTNDPHSNESGDPGYYLSPNVYPDFVSYSVFAGVRSYLTNHFSVWLELGYGYSSLSFGVCYKV